jgi:hypothetical protein
MPGARGRLRFVGEECGPRAGGHGLTGSVFPAESTEMSDINHSGYTLRSRFQTTSRTSAEREAAGGAKQADVSRRLAVVHHHRTNEYLRRTGAIQALFMLVVGVNEQAHRRQADCVRQSSSCFACSINACGGAAFRPP